MGDWLRDHLDPKLRQLGSRAIEPEAAAIGPATHTVAEPGPRSAAARADGG
jgi:hypothetical protein